MINWDPGKIHLYSYICNAYLRIEAKNKLKILNLQQKNMCNLHAFSSSSLLTTFLEDPSELLANKLRLTNSDFNNDQNIFAYDVDQIRSFKKIYAARVEELLSPSQEKTRTSNRNGFSAYVA